MQKLKAENAKGVVVGLKGVAGVEPRRDIEDFLLRNPDSFNLFILALTDFMNDKETDKIMGYYQIAGIHGLPKQFWDGVKGDGKDVTSGEGYCAHGTITFPTWHRPYLAMIEQAIYLKMLEKAEDFPAANRQTYRDAAQHFRLPYWDYYRPRATKSNPAPTDYDFAMPRIFLEKEIMVRTTAKNELQPLSNPLRSFVFPTGKLTEAEWLIADKTGKTTFSRIDTQRHPQAASPLTPVTELNKVLDGARDNGTEYIIDLMTNYHDYSPFASAAAAGGGPRSLEGIHGNYHIRVGGVAGHMSEVLVSAFDPIFWFHHCQIDRWLAVWQASYPIDWFRSGEEAQERQNLYPFRVSKDGAKETYWNSDHDRDNPRSSRSTDIFGYYYSDAKADSKAALKDFLGLYNWSARRVSGVRPVPPKGMEPLDMAKAQAFQPPSTIPAVVSGPAIGVQKVVANAIESVKAGSPGFTAPVSQHLSSRSPARMASSAQSSQADVPDSLLVPQTTFAGLDALDKSTVSRMWSIDHVVERLALNGSFTIYYFVGSFESGDPRTYMSQDHLAGLSHNFAAPVEACDNCGRQDEQAHLVADGTPITSTLLDYVDSGELLDLEPENVKPFLLKNLKWRVATAQGDIVNPRSVRGLKLNISCRSMPIPPATQPDPPTREEYPEIIEEIIANSS